METTFARKRLEEMRDDLDRTIAVLQGEGPGPVAGAGYPLVVILNEPAVPVVNVALDGAPVRGPANAPVTIVEFSDFQ